MPCKNMCSAHYTDAMISPPRTAGVSVYLDGWRRCSQCKFYTQYTDDLCICCRRKFRTKPKYSKAKTFKSEQARM